MWRYMSLPESPRWLVDVDREDEAGTLLFQVWGLGFRGLKFEGLLVLGCGFGGVLGCSVGPVGGLLDMGEGQDAVWVFSKCERARVWLQETRHAAGFVHAREFERTLFQDCAVKLSGLGGLIKAASLNAKNRGSGHESKTDRLGNKFPTLPVFPRSLTRTRDSENTTAAHPASQRAHAFTASVPMSECIGSASMNCTKFTKNVEQCNAGPCLAEH